MNLKITGLNFDVTEAIKNYVSDKLARINRHADNIISVTITLSVEKVNQKAEADVHLAGKDLHVEAIEQDMYAAIDVLRANPPPGAYGERVSSCPQHYESSEAG